MSQEVRIMDQNQWDLSHLVGHVFSTGAIFGSLLGLLGYVPGVLAALAAFCWYCIQIIDSPRVRTWAARRRQRRILHLKAIIAELENIQKEEPPTMGDDTL